MVGGVGVAGEGAEREAAIGGHLDRIERQRVHVDQPFRSLDAFLHQVDQVRAAGEIAHAGCATVCRERFLDARRA
jgi:hypothetical protein